MSRFSMAVAALVVGTFCALGAEVPAYAAKETFPMRVSSGLGAFDVALTAKDAAPGAALTARLVNTEGEVVATGKGVWGTDTVGFSLKPDNYGLFDVQVLGDGEIPVFTTRQAVLRPLPERFAKLPANAFRFGVNTHFDHKLGDLDVLPQLLAQAGFRWIRDTMYWAHVEKEKGTYAIRPYNQTALDNLRKHGISALLCLCYSNPHYAHGTAEEAEGYGKYAEFVAKATKGYGDVYEIWNEPNGFAKLSPQEYPAILKAGYEGVKKANPEALVIGMGGPSAGGWGGHYIPTVLKLGGQAWMDSFSIHPYCSPHTAEAGYPSKGGPAPRSSLDYVHPNTCRLAEKIRESKGLDKAPGVWVTEIGWPSQQTDPQAQAQQIARNFIYSAARPNDIARTFLYDMVCDGTDPNNREHTFGLVLNDYTPRPSYVAAATATRAVDGLPFIRRIEHPYDGVHLYLFGTDEDAVLAAWVAEVSGKELESGTMQDGRPSADFKRAGSWPDKTITISLDGLQGTPELRDWQDRTQTLDVKDGKATLRLTTWPQYLHGLKEPAGVTLQP
jgi:hypothetical protein